MPKSRTGSYGSARLRAAVAGCAPESSTSVWPSGGDFASASFASSPAPPGLFSTTTGWPRRSESFCPRRRLTRSLPEPGGEPTRKRIGRAGYCCAIVSAEASAASAASIAAANLTFISRGSKDSGRVRIQLESSMQLRESREDHMAHAQRTFTRRRFIQATAAGSLALAGGGFGRISRAQAVKPNIVFILADDLGYADVSCYGQRDYTTPNIDRLAVEGLRFTQGYANSAVCSSTRTALITGRYQYRLPVGLEEPISATARNIGLPPEHPTLPGLLKKAGYLSDLLGNHAVSFIEAARQPFFLSLHFNAPHWPWEGPGDEAESRRITRLIDRDGGSMKTYAQMVTRMDMQVGRVL